MLDLILSRRSIRKFTAEPVSEEIINDILEAAMSAPSAGNEQPWHFVVIRDRSKMEEILVHHPNALALKSAAAAILVCADKNSNKFEIDYWIQDFAAATENLLLAAHFLGLGAVWLGVYPREERCAALKKVFGMPENIVPFSLVALGYPAEEKPPANRFRKDRIHLERW